MLEMAFAFIILFCILRFFCCCVHLFLFMRNVQCVFSWRLYMDVKKENMCIFMAPAQANMSRLSSIWFGRTEFHFPIQIKYFIEPHTPLRTHTVNCNSICDVDFDRQTKTLNCIIHRNYAIMYLWGRQVISKMCKKIPYLIGCKCI